MNVYLDLTREFNAGKLRVVICSRQAVVLHKLAVMSKDGDWILREDEEALDHVLTVLANHGARYRFGAPLDVRWMSGGWSAHFEYRQDPLRIRTDFFTRPPRLSGSDLVRIWQEQQGNDPPVLNVKDLAEIKKTNREKDFSVIGELARIMPEVADRFLYSRSARDLIALARQHPEVAVDVVKKRPLLKLVSAGRDRLEEALDAEKRALIRANEERLAAFMDAAEKWVEAWPDVAREISSRSLMEAHSIVVKRAEGVLPFKVHGGHPDA